jgi:hypothetical protein
MNPRYAFRPTDLTTLLDLAEPADQAIQDILLRRSAIDITEPPQESEAGTQQADTAPGPRPHTMRLTDSQTPHQEGAAVQRLRSADP